MQQQSLTIELAEPDAGAGDPGRQGWRRFIGRPRLSWRALRISGAVVVMAALANWTIGGFLIHRVDTDTSFEPPAELVGGSRAVTMAAALLDREINRNAWTPNDPLSAPSAWLDNMPNYQEGILRAVGQFTFDLFDQIARTRGSSSIDPDLERASGFLQFPPDIWVLELEKSWLPTIPTEQQYRAGLVALARYNERLAEGNAIFDRRADAFAQTMQQVAAELGARTAILDRTRQGGQWVFNTAADDLFYENKGMLYAYYMILSALGTDFDAMIRERGLTLVWSRALENLHDASQLNPPIILNGDSDRSIFANHLMLQGFYMKRAILQLDEVVSVLAV